MLHDGICGEDSIKLFINCILINKYYLPERLSVINVCLFFSSPLQWLILTVGSFDRIILWASIKIIDHYIIHQ